MNSKGKVQARCESNETLGPRFFWEIQRLEYIGELRFVVRRGTRSARDNNSKNGNKGEGFSKWGGALGNIGNPTVDR